MQVPLAIIMGAAIFIAIHPTTFSHRDPAKDQIQTSRLSQVDFLGVFFLISTVTLFLYGLSTPKLTFSTILASGISFIAFIVIESQPKLSSSQPILPLSVLKSAPVLLTCLSTLCIMIARWSILFYTPVYALSVRDFPPVKAGLILLPTNGGFALGNLLLGFFHVRRSGSFYTACLVAYALFTLSVVVISRITTRQASMSAYFCVAGVNGFMIGAGMIYTLTHVLHRTSKDTHLIVSGLLAMFRALSASFGSAIGGGIFERVAYQALERGFEERGFLPADKQELIRKLVGSPAMVSSLVGVEREVALDGYVVALKALFTAAAMVAALATVLQAGTGWRAPPDELEGATSGVLVKGDGDRGHRDLY